ncbi:MAG: ABC transporter permease [Chloroflexi bacterium]|nr:ABC transporter permease [Chloroflexota bacterium]
MHIIDLALKDLLQIFRDWKAAFFLFVMPILFTIVFGYAFGGLGGGDEETDPRIPVGFSDQDNGQLSQVLFDLLDASDAIRPVTFDEEITIHDLDKMVDEDEIAAVVIVPAKYSDALLGGETIKLTTILKSDTAAGTTAQNGIETAVNRLVNSVDAANFSTQVYAQQNPFVDETARQEFFDGAINQAVAAWDNPPLMLVTSQTGSDEAAKGEPVNAFAHSSAGMMVQFAITGLIGAAEVLVLERKSGSLQRLLTTAISRTEILIGHFLAMFTMIFIQFAILIVFAQAFLQVEYFNAPLATLLVTVAATLFTASMGLLIGTLAKTPDQVVMFVLIPMFIFSGLGGAWVPLEFTSPAFQTIAHFTPLAWAMDGFENIIVRGMGLESVFLPAGVLLGFAAVCFGLAVWKFKFE